MTTSFLATDLNQKNRQVEHLFRLLFLVMALLLILPVLLILAVLVWKGGPVLSLEFLFTEPKQGMTAGGILPALVGTVWLVSVALLASVPSIVHALFGVGAFVLFFRFGTSILAASLTLAIMTLPVVIVATKESLQAVPQAFREACWNMGATRWQTIRRVVLPNSISGILTGIILEVSRTAGETAPIMFTGAAFFLPFLPQSVLDQTMAMSLHLFVISTQVPGVPEALPYGVALVLISMVLAMNALSIAFRIYLRGRKKW
jgi:phosphate transport system permease protein